MSTYAIGDIQGCFEPFERLLKEIEFNAERDQIWLVGDMVNRGPQSLEVLRWCRTHQDNVVAVLGNHDVHLLAVDYGVQTKGPRDTLDAVLEAPDKDELLDWLRNRPLVYTEGNFMMVHAGLLPGWSQNQALHLAHEVENILRGSDAPLFLAQYRGLVPPEMEDATSNIERARFILAVLTRIRICDTKGRPEWSFKGGSEDIPPDHLPWFDAPQRASGPSTIVCGHWAALGLHLTDRLIALDSGCAWGRELSAVRLDDRAVFQVSA